MNIVSLSLKSIISRPLSSFLSWMLLSFGVVIMALILLVSSQMKEDMERNTSGVDLVVGAKGSPMQLILSSIFHIDFPTGNISLTQAHALSGNRLVAEAIPLSLGDSHQGYRIVGTTRKYAALYDATIADGSWFEGPMQAVVGSEVAGVMKWQPGDTFESQHGLVEDAEDHGEHPFTVSGILQPTGTVLDRLILVDVPSVWMVHGHEEEHATENDTNSLVALEKLGITVRRHQLEEEQITAVLIKYRTPMGAVMLPRIVNEMSDLQAASPAYETSRLFNILGSAIQVANLLGLIIILISAISIFIALLNSLKERKYEIAVMRTMGATRLFIVTHVLFEGMIISLLGAVSGTLIAHLLFGAIGIFTDSFQPNLWRMAPGEWLVVVGCLAVGILASIIPAWISGKTNISETLARGS